MMMAAAGLAPFSAVPGSPRIFSLRMHCSIPLDAAVFRPLLRSMLARFNPVSGLGSGNKNRVVSLEAKLVSQFARKSLDGRPLPIRQLDAKLLP